MCSICGQSGCVHKGGKRYDGRLCFFTLSRPTDAYEWSFVAVPAQRKAGVIKAFGQEGEGDLKRLLAGRPGYLKQLEALEKEAQLGRSYMEGLRKELVRLAGLADEALDLTVFSALAERMEERELIEMTKAYRHRLDSLYPPRPQIQSRGAAVCADEDSEFVV